MAERIETKIDYALLEMVRHRAAEEGRKEEEIIEEAVGRYLRENGGGEEEKPPWPRYPLFDSKVLCHNLCVLIHAIHALEIEPNFSAESRPALKLVE